MPSLPFFEVDVFASGPFSGNPLAVVAEADGLGVEEMARIAAWTNFSETTFLLRPRDPAADYRVRIFTPSGELPFAGHPTLGTARAWLALGHEPAGGAEIVQECEAGLIPVRREDDLLLFATPPRRRADPLTSEETAEIAALAGVAAEEVVAASWGDNGPGWRILQLPDADAVRAANPAPGVGGLKYGLVGLEPEGAEHAYEVRAISVDREDPVTGSLNGAVAQWLRERGLVPDRYTAVQGSRVGRDGRIRIVDDGREIWVGGRAALRVRGEIEV
jgi:PhzF family phenazine biosynthesis protein